MSQRPEWKLHVFFQEEQSPRSPWPWQPLAPYERVLPGLAPGWPTLRSHINWSLPALVDYDVWILNVLLTSWTGQRLMRRLTRAKIPWIYWGERWRQQRHPIKQWVQNRLLRSVEAAQGIAAIGAWAEQDYQARFPRVPVVNMPYATSTREYMQNDLGNERGSSTECCRFLFCGQMIARKGIDLVLRSFHRLLEAGVSARLTLVGRLDEEKILWEGLPEGAWREQVEVVGFVAPADLPPYFHQADVFVLPSRHDGWGVVVHQAVAAGLPLILSDAVGAGRDLLVDQENGILVPGGEMAPLAKAMQLLASEPTTRRKMAGVSRKLADKISPELMAQRWIEFVDRVFP